MDAIAAEAVDLVDSYLEEDVEEAVDWELHTDGPSHVGGLPHVIYQIRAR